MAMDAQLQALAEPRRRQILALIGDGERSAGDIAAHFEITRPAISQHLAVLREAGLVTARRDGTRRLYSARPQGVVEIRAWIDRFWRDGLERLRAEAEKEAGTR